VPFAFVVPKDPASVADESNRASLREALIRQVDTRLGAIARPSVIHFVTLLPKTRSGKLLRRSIQAICEGRAVGDITTLEDPDSLDRIRMALSG